jgi:hypothetical protein
MSESNDNIDRKKSYQTKWQMKKYNADPVKARAYQNSVKMRRRLNVSDEIWDKYKEHLCNVVKLLTIVKQLPPDLFHEILENPPNIDLKEDE